MRQIVLDTETTGLEPQAGHRIIEIGLVEIAGRRITGQRWRWLINPEREIDEGATQVHGLSLDDLRDQPTFAGVVDEFLARVDGCELIIHNAPFDVGFLNHELRLLGPGRSIADHCGVLDTLQMARRMHPGQRNSLDALCQRYEVDNSGRTLHGALLDAELLAEVYLRMTGGQVGLALAAEAEHLEGDAAATEHTAMSREGLSLRVFPADAEEVRAHEARLDAIEANSGGVPRWRADDA